MASTRVYVEKGSKRVFASAADWPGWSRWGRDEAAALEALAAYAPRYARVTKLAKIELPKDAKGGAPKVGDKVTVHYKMVAAEIEAKK